MLFNRGDGQTVNPRCVRTSVTRDPVERHNQRRRVVHKVEQVLEPAVSIDRRPTVQLGLHLRYPAEHLGRSAAIQQRVSRHCSLLSTPHRCRPSPCGRLSRPRSTTATPPHLMRSADGAPIPATEPVHPWLGADTGWFPCSLLFS